VEAHQLAAVVNRLFLTHRRPDGREYTNQEVSDTLDGAIHPSTISKLRTGQVGDPRRTALMLLCKFFGESPLIFFPELAMGPLEDPVVVALRGTSLDPEQQEKLAAFIKTLEQKYKE
jgi:hypothetical protein